MPELILGLAKQRLGQFVGQEQPELLGLTQLIPKSTMVLMQQPMAIIKLERPLALEQPLPLDLEFLEELERWL